MKNKIILVVSILFGLMMINSGLNKFLNYMPAPEMSADAMAAIECFISTRWLWPLIGFGEVLGGLLFMIPRLRLLGAIMIFPIVIGILFFNMLLSPMTLPVAVILLLINIYVIWEGRKVILPIIESK